MFRSFYPSFRGTPQSCLRKYKTVLFTVIFSVAATVVLAQPTITSFTPISGASGSSIVITGTNFNATPAGNAVFFNGAKGTVTAASATQLTVTIPVGARSGFIDVVNTSTFRQVKSKQSFTVSFSGTGFGSSSFAAPVNYTLGTSSAPREVDLADIDNDGKLDIVASRTNLAVGVLRNTTTGTSNNFAAVTTLSSRTNTQCFTLHDMNSDGKLDLYETLVPAATVTNSFVTLNASTAGVITSGTSVTAGGTNAGSSMRGTAAADISSPADGKPDALWVFETSGGVANSNAYANVNTGNAGSIGFANNVVIMNSASNKRMWDVVAADFDGDGLNDMATYETGSGGVNNLLIARNTTTSGFTPSAVLSIALSTASPQAGRIMVNDMDADGKPDLLLFVGASNVRIFRNTSTSGSISFVNAGDFGGTVANKSYFTIEDVTADGKLDIVFACNSTIGSVAVLPNVTTGSTISFGTPVLFDGSAATDVAVGDVNGDGKPDIVTISNSNHNANVYINAMVTVPAPTITSFTPTAGNTGTQVVITGSNFTGATAVSFGGNNTAAQSFTVNSATQITATVAAGTNTGTVKVTTAGGVATSAANFTIVAIPTITSFTPTSGSIGTQVVITGANFTGATAVTFGVNNTPAQSFTVNSATQITATVGTGTNTGTVKVTTAGGVATSATNFTVTAATPTISNVNPTSGAAGTVVTVFGTHFTGATAVTFGANNTPAQSFTVNSATQITATIASGTTTGPGPVRVVTPAGTATINGFLVTSTAPTVTGIVGPINGLLTWIVTGGLLTINGTNFTGATAVTIGTGNTPVTNFTVVSATQITCRVSGATTTGSGPIRITTPGGTVVSNNYTIISGLPVINSFTPTTGTAGTTVVINGAQLYIDNGAPNPTVTIGANNTPATVLGYSGNDLSVSVGAGTTTGPITVTTTYGSVTSVSNFNVSSPTPTVTSVSQLSATAGTTITITGTNLTNASVAVSFSNFPVLSNNGTTMIVQVPVNVVSGSMDITTPAGTVAAGFFTFQTNSSVLQHRSGQVLTLTGPAGALSYQWQVDQGNGTGFVNLTNAGVYSGVNTSTLVINGISTGATGYRYRVSINGNSPQPALTLRFVTYAAGSGNWNNAASWIGGVIPDVNTDVIADDVSISVTANASVRTLMVTNGAQVQVASGVRFTVRQ